MQGMSFVSEDEALLSTKPEGQTCYAVWETVT